LLENEKQTNGSEHRPILPGPVKAGRSTGLLSTSPSWDDLVWIRKVWDGPIAIKGIQCVDDARLAVVNGVEAIYLSNHGGRQLDSALLELR